MGRVGSQLICPTQSTASTRVRTSSNVRQISSDSSYVRIRATGKYKDENDDDVALTPVTVDVNNFPYWSLGSHRTKHLTAPDGLTQAGLQEWAEAQAEKYQYIGIGEDFTGPFRPQLIVGDVAEVIEDNVGTALGLITEVRQVFS